MIRTALAHLRAQWMGALALFLVLAGGTAYAANTVFSSDIVDGEVKQADIGEGAVASNEIQNDQILAADVRNDTLANGGLTAADLRAGSVTTAEVANDTSAGGGLAAPDLRAGSVGSSEVANGSIQDGDLAASARGARAFALVRGKSCGDPVAFCTLLRSKRVAYAVHVGEGNFCVGVDGISATGPTSLPLVTPTIPGVARWAHWQGAFGSNTDCVETEFQTRTGVETSPDDIDFMIIIP